MSYTKDQMITAAQHVLNADALSEAGHQGGQQQQ